MRPANGDVYFRVTKDKQYGKLSGRKLEDMQAGARIEVDEAKEHPMDFALWKTAKPGEPAWDSPWGKGRPGWHIECSAMNLAELGEQIDIHGGGNDLIFPHHENEIAQSESFTGKQFARFWIHNGMLQLSGEKMSKSLGNIISIEDFLSQHARRRDAHAGSERILSRAADLQRRDDRRRREESGAAAVRIPRGSGLRERDFPGGRLRLRGAGRVDAHGLHRCHGRRLQHRAGPGCALRTGQVDQHGPRSGRR